MEVIKNGNKCGGCGAPIAGRNNSGRCEYCNMPYADPIPGQTQQVAEHKSIDAIRMERDAETYIQSARNAAYVFAGSLVVVVITAIFTELNNDNSLFVNVLNIVASTSFWAALVLFFIGRSKRKKARRMK